MTEEENQNSEDFITDIIKKSGIAEPNKDEKRVSKIISQSRRNVGTRDYITLIFVRFWIILAEFACKTIAYQSIEADKRQKNSENKSFKVITPKE